jgi:methionyl-tRNA formyltransferase
MRVYVIGQKAFGAAVAELVRDAGHDLVAVASPAFADASVPGAFDDDEQTVHDPLRLYAGRTGTPWGESDTLIAERVPACDLIIAAHSQIIVAEPVRAKAALATVGFQPSLLPLHRGRDAVRWTIRDHDRVTGGTVYHLTDRIYAGPIAAQDFVLVPPGSTAESLWREHLFPLGLRLFRRVLDDLAAGRVVAERQNEACATWEPVWELPWYMSGEEK